MVRTDFWDMSPIPERKDLDRQERESRSCYRLHEEDATIAKQLYYITNKILNPRLSPEDLHCLAKLRHALARLPYTTEDALLELTFTRGGRDERQQYTLEISGEAVMISTLYATYDPDIRGTPWDNCRTPFDRFTIRVYFSSTTR